MMKSKPIVHKTNTYLNILLLQYRRAIEILFFQ